MVGPLISQKMKQLQTLGGAAKQLSKKNGQQTLSRRCHVAMASIVNDLWDVRSHVLKAYPDYKDFFDAFMLLYRDCQNGYEEDYINGIFD